MTIPLNNSLNNSPLQPRVLDFDNGNNNINKNESPEVKQRLDFGNNNVELDTTITFEEYETQRLNHIEQNIDELMNYDKNKLIQKIKSNVKTLGDEKFEDMSFSELWDILINDRVKTFTKSFKDSQYETIFTELFDKLSSFDSRSINYQNENNSHNFINYNNRNQRGEIPLELNTQSHEEPPRTPEELNIPSPEESQQPEELNTP